jgi:hypothetical protein
MCREPSLFNRHACFHQYGFHQCGVFPRGGTTTASFTGTPVTRTLNSLSGALNSASSSPGCRGQFWENALSGILRVGCEKLSALGRWATLQKQGPQATC